MKSLLTCCLIVMLALPGPSGFCAGVDQDLKLWLQFDDTSGGVVHDSSGRGHDGKPVNKPSFVKGFSNLSASFAGENQYLEFADRQNGDLDLGTRDFSFALWIRRDKPGTRGTVFNKKNGNMTTGYDLTVLNTGVFGVYFMDPYDSDYNFLGSKSSLDDGLWHHVAVTVRRSGEIAMYLDGELDCAHYCPEALTAIENNDKLVIGGAVENGKFKDPFSGQLDDLRIYGRELSAAEVQNLYVTSARLSYWDDGKNVIVRAAGAGAQPGWKAAISKKGGGDITEFCLPENGLNLSEGIFGMFYMSKVNPDGKQTKGLMHDQGRIEKIELLKRESEEIVVAVTARGTGWYLLGPMGETVVEYRQVYTFKPDGIQCDGEVKWIYGYNTRMLCGNLLTWFRHDAVQLPIYLTDEQGKKIELELSSSKGMNYPEGFISPKIIDVWLKNGNKLTLRALNLPALYRNTRHGGLERPWQLRNWMIEVAIEGNAEVAKQAVPQPLHYVWEMGIGGPGVKGAPPIVELSSPRRDRVYKVGDRIDFQVSARDRDGKALELHNVEWNLYKMYKVPLANSNERAFSYTIPKDIVAPEQKFVDLCARVRVKDGAGNIGDELVKFHVENR